MTFAMIAEAERAAGPQPMSFMDGSMLLPAAGGKIIEAPLTPTPEAERAQPMPCSMVFPAAGCKTTVAPLTATAEAERAQPVVPLQVSGNCRLGLHGYPYSASSQQIYPVVLPPPWPSASTRAGSETSINDVDGSRKGASPAPVRIVSVPPTEPQEVVGTARLKTRDIFEEAAEFATLKAISARRDAEMQQMEAELRRKDDAVKARDEQITKLKRCCEELQRRAQGASPLATEGPHRLDAEMIFRTPRPLHGRARGDTGVRRSKVVRDISGNHLPRFSGTVSAACSSFSVVQSDLEEEPVQTLYGSAAQGETEDEVDAKVHEYFARFPDFKLPVERLKPGSYYFGEPVHQAVSVQLTRRGKAVLKVCGKFRSLDSFLDAVRGTSQAAYSLSPGNHLASVRRSEYCRAGSLQRLRAWKHEAQGTKAQTSMLV